MDRHRILVTGCRRWYCLALAESVVCKLLAKHGTKLLVVHGAAPGVDTAFANACDLNGVDHAPHPARWSEYGKAAGPKRNQEMLDTGPAACIAVHRDLAGSRGTRDMVRKCLAAGVPVWLIDNDTDDPVRPKRITEV